MRTAKRLPTMAVGDKTYFIDSRLRELRNTENPHDRISFSRIVILPGARKIIGKKLLRILAQ